nr:phosphoribosylanthranilate isomerase [Maliibacterium massiliense]
MTQLKICGLTRAEDVRMCCALGVDIAGFVVEYPGNVPWNLSRKAAAPLLACVSGATRRCIVTGGAPARVLALAEALRPDYVQLHYSETLEETRLVAQALHAMGIRTIKAIPVTPEGACQMPGFSTPEQAARALSGTKAAMLLLDARSACDPAAPGRTLDLALYRRVQQAAALPVALAGGLTPENLASVLTQAAPPMVDILSGVERASGCKDAAAVRRVCTLCGK